MVSAVRHSVLQQAPQAHQCLGIFCKSHGDRSAWQRLQVLCILAEDGKVRCGGSRVELSVLPTHREACFMICA